MNKAYLRICQLLASSGYRDHEIAEFAKEISQSSYKALVEDVGQLRSLMNYSGQGLVFDTPSNASHPAPSDVGMKIERLLILEAGLPRAVAIEQLTSVLQSRFPSISVPPEARKGFRPWIRKLTSLIPEKELLHIATSLRNRMVHETPSDWRLK